MDRVFLDLSELGNFTADAVENDTVSFIAAYDDGSIFTCNRAFCNLTGYSKPEVSAMHWPDDFTHAGQRARAMNIINGISCDLRPHSYELEFVRKDGSLVPVDLYVHKFYDQNGHTRQNYSFITDMTEHKRLEEALRSSETKYRELVENANSIILKMDTNGNIIFFNEFAQRFFGYGLADILGKNVIGTIVPLTESSGRDLEKMIEDICIYPERHINNENENMRNTGERVWVSWTNRAILDDRCNTVGILCVGNDITALNRTESELRRSRDELEIRVKERTIELEKVNAYLMNEIDRRKSIEKEIVASEEKFRTLAETSPVAIFFHRGICFIYANPAAEKIVGITAEKIETMKFWDLFTPEYRDLVKERGLARLRGEHPPASYEVKLQTNGPEKWMDITSARVMYKGEPAILTIGQDVTPYKQTLAALEDLKVEAELYVDLMGHDISNMNQVGMGNLELLRDNITVNEAGEAQLLKAMNAFKNSSELINNVRKLKKVKNGDLSLEKIDLGRLLDKVANDYRAVPGRSVSIHFEPRDGYFVIADKLVFDVFSSIVDNAIKYSCDPVEINIGLHGTMIDGQQYHRVSIEDNGPGISPVLKKRIFNRMYYEGGIMRGKGLGLYLVKTLVECFHGAISVEDRVEGDRSKGSRFVVLLPAI